MDRIDVLFRAYGSPRSKRKESKAKATQRERIRLGFLSLLFFGLLGFLFYFHLPRPPIRRSVAFDDTVKHLTPLPSLLLLLLLCTCPPRFVSRLGRSTNEKSPTPCPLGSPISCVRWMESMAMVGRKEMGRFRRMDEAAGLACDQ